MVKVYNSVRFQRIAIPLLSVLLGVLIGGMIMLAFGFDPIAGYTAMVKGALFTPFYIGQTLRLAAPLIVIALGFAVANKAGFFNIGLSGQALMGWFASIVVAGAFPDLPRIILVPLAVLAGMVAGALWAGIAGVLRAYFNTSEVIVTIMLNHTSFHLVNYLIRNVLTSGGDSTPVITPNASMRIPFLTSLTDNSTIHAGIFVSLIMVVVIMVFMNKTTYGFELRSVGLNADAAEYSGMNAKKNIILAMLISGALAGLGGTMEGLGNFQNIFIQGGIPGIGFDGMGVALLGASSPIGILFSALLFSILKTGGTSMPLVSGSPNEIVDIVIALIIFFVGANYIIRFLLAKSQKTNKKEVA
ncbi:ABC transporter permease [Jeotgalibaca caeni]|uniref:ABC transporter permease n=1 Tax=Jeotgalibaca caeni TaxID=3028623 RepID=UPI00237DAC1F|nr:ABC transporter permease [Jeotgalibaca caeni]MDE1548951.1 ABC transporter permease [Jeotgalibaca caeni]